MELTLVGLQHSGKTTFVNVIAVSVSKTYLIDSGAEVNSTPNTVSVCFNHGWGGLFSCYLCSWELRSSIYSEYGIFKF